MASEFVELKKGSTGDSVKELQTALNSAGYGLDVDGVFGDQTASALSSWQTANGMDATGVFDSNAYNTMFGTNTKSGTDYSALKNELLTGLTNAAQNGYTQKTEEQIQSEAAARVASTYDAQRLAAQQAADKQALTLDTQLASLGADYADAIEKSNAQYSKAISAQDRSLLSRGMQRSSYGMQTLAGLRNEGAQAAGDIALREAQARSGIESQKAQLADQLAQQMAQYDVSEQTDAQAYADQLRDTEYNRGVQAQSTSNALMQNLLSLLQSYEANEISQDQWERQFAESIREWNLSNGYNADGSEKKKTTGGYTPPAQNPTAEELAAQKATDTATQLANLANALNIKTQAKAIYPIGKVLGTSHSTKATTK